MPALQELEKEASAAVAAVKDKPQGRLECRQAFYRKYGFADRDGLEFLSEYGYGASELAFLEWEIERGVLDPVGRFGGGSPWWRAVNGDFLYDGELAALAYEAKLPAAELPAASRAWLDYIADPNEQTWYTAHNSSIVRGYEARKREAEAERRYEQVFINMVLYRLLYAQGMVEGVEMGMIGKLLADPVLPSVDVMVGLPDFYPRSYPLSRKAIKAVLHQGHGLEEFATKVLDLVLISPHLTGLYQEASRWLSFPTLNSYVRYGEPVYPALKPSSVGRHGFVRFLRFLGRVFRGHLHA